MLNFLAADSCVSGMLSKQRLLDLVCLEESFSAWTKVHPDQFQDSDSTCSYRFSLFLQAEKMSGMSLRFNFAWTNLDYLARKMIRHYSI